MLIVSLLSKNNGTCEGRDDEENIIIIERIAKDTSLHVSVEKWGELQDCDS